MERSIIVFLCMIWNLHVTVICQENKTVTILLNQTLSWVDGVRECHGRNGTLISEEEAKSLDRNVWPSGGQPEREHWTGKHQYLSNWLGTLGNFWCNDNSNYTSRHGYPGWELESKIRGVSRDNFKMDISSPGACQEYCSTQLFAIAEGTTCLCVPISEVSKFTVQTTKVLNWTTCDNPETPDTCGGNEKGENIASLYGNSVYLGVNVASANGNCALARCDTNSLYTQFKSQDCQLNQDSSCTGSQSEVQSTWDHVYRSCLNVSSLLATSLSACSLFIQTPRIRNSDYWIGHRRQFYTRNDRGDNINLTLVQKCQSCNSSGSCTFQTQCRNTQKFVFCTVPLSEETTTSTTPGLSVETTSSSPPGQTTTGEPITVRRKPDEPFPLLLVLIAVGGTLVVTLILILTAIICLRQRRKRETNKEKESARGTTLSTTPQQNTTGHREQNYQSQTNIDKDTYDHLDHSGRSWPKEECDSASRPDNQNIYHVVETNNVIAENESNVYDVSSPKGDPHEDVYNHLREDSPGARSDNVYDVGGRPDTLEQGIYNHLHADTTQGPDDHYACYGMN